MCGRTSVALVSALVIAATAFARNAHDQVQQGMTTTPVLSQVATGTNAPPKDDGATDILLVGDDRRTDLQGNPLPAYILRQLRTEANDGFSTDTLILLRIPKDGSKSYAVSIPRDTEVPIDGYRTDKINAAYGAVKYLTAQRMRAAGEHDNAKIERDSDAAGRQALVSSVQQLTGLTVDHYAEVSLYGFYLLSQAIGGVPVCLLHATSDPNSGANFGAGPQSVSGGNALSFVRQRENLPNGDLDRIVRQQVFLASAAKKVLSAGTLLDPDRLGALTAAVQKSVVIDQGWDVLGFVQQAQSLTGGNVAFVTIPVVNSNGRNERGQSIVVVDRDAVKKFVAGLASGAPSGFTARGPLRLNAAVDPITVNGTRCVN
ncbi:LCP family protein [Kutzneria chonburiensis]|uniref:LCP family protein n=1 Tax=Kutzneria chonburiensis TaxID=1483604 RepID=A0ABV6MW18_9PSEU|nr:LCP family protein [Kutzneria chonburiensis]